MKHSPTVFRPDLITQSTKLTNTYGTPFDMIDST